VKLARLTQRPPFDFQAAILYNLKLRHINEKPYTRTGDIVIAVNPYKWHDHLYTEQKRNHYSNRLVWEPSDCDPRGTLDPHIYEVSALSYKGLAFEGADQSILVSGESGAGKTETVKICLNHIATVQRGHMAEQKTSNDYDPVVKLVVDSNPLLEAFGNAKTIRNDNSSRFGKFLQLQFDKDAKGTRCGLVGSKSEVYLLEKNRVVGHEPNERTFHIFYQLLAAPETVKRKFWNGLLGTTNESFSYIGYTDTNKIEGLTDSNRFRETIQALESVGIKDDKLDYLMKALCIVLQLGNLGFDEHHGDTDKSTITTESELKALADLMQLPVEQLSMAMTERTFNTRDETHKVPLNATAAKEACDALAKEAYQKIFLWLVSSINEATSANLEDGKNYGVIGLLDIFGFEAFKINRFEQLCINYANEKLQQKFTEDIFKNVQAEYEAEGIDLAEIWYDDNTDVLDLIEGSTGLLNMLNEECVRPKGCDQDFVQKALLQNKSSTCLVVDKFDRMSFGIHHYAGRVMYDAEAFVSKNLDTLPTDLQLCTEKCSNPIINTERIEGRAGKSVGSSRRGAPVKSESNITAKTVWTKYKSQLAKLMSQLHKTRSRYIRCIKPNTKKVPTLMQHHTVLEQLRCAGVVAGITISRAVFPNQLENSVVLSRYSNMWEKQKYPSQKTSDMSPNERRAEDCKALMTCALKPKEERENRRVVKAFAVGKTRTYFRTGALEWLESSRMSGLDAQAITIQSVARGWLARRQAGKEENRKDKESEKREAETREWEARQVELKEESDERAALNEKERRSTEEKIKQLRKALKKADEDSIEALAAAERHRSQTEEEIAVLDAKFEKAQAKDFEPKAVLKEQEAKLEETKKLIMYLKKENKRARNQYDKLLEKSATTRSDAKRHLAYNEDVGNNFEGLDAETTIVSDKNDDLMDKLGFERKENKRLVKLVRNMQDQYMAEAENRLKLQKGMAKILNIIQGECKDAQIVEDSVVIALECETEAKSEMAALDAMDEDCGYVSTDVSDSESHSESHSDYQ
jgi:myosin-5